MITVAIDLRMYGLSGIGRYLQSVIPEVLPQINSDQIVVFGDIEALRREDWAHDTRVKLHDERAAIFSAREQLNALSKKYMNADVLWSPQYNVPMLRRGKLVVTIHDLCQLAHPETLGSNLQRFYARMLISRAVRQADAILCVSEFTRDELRKYLGADPSRITVTYPGRGLISPAGLSRPAKTGERPYILAVGNVKPHKNLSRLLAAFELAQQQVSHDLVLVGKRDGFLNPDNLEIDPRNIEDGRVRFTGKISDEELMDYYRGADALVLPSIYEGFGFPLVEAMAQGCPVACSNAASLPEVAGDAALLFDPFNIHQIAESMIAIVTNSSLRKHLIEKGLARAARYSAKKCGQQTAEVINRVLENQ
jgi:glycosyltransferase involved in cell wall biosynthesis